MPVRARRNAPPGRRRWSSYLCVAVVVTGCTEGVTDNGAAPPSQPPVSAEIVTPEIDPAFDLKELPPSEHPVDKEWRELVPFAEDFDELWELAYTAWQAGISTCMAERGFTYVGPAYFDEMRTEYFRAMNPLNARAAEAIAYHQPELPSPSPVAVPAVGADEFEVALHGTNADPSFGCASSAFGEAYAGVEELSNRYQALVDDLDARLAEYPSTQRAIDNQEAWRQCMSLQGYEFANRDEIYVHFGGTAEITGEERVTRRADLQCDLGVGVTVDRSTWERSQAEAWLAESADEWERLHADGELIVGRMQADQP